MPQDLGHHGTNGGDEPDDLEQVWAEDARLARQRARNDAIWQAPFKILGRAIQIILDMFP